MNHLVPTNARVKTVERSAGFDRYGQPLQNVIPVATNFRARMTRRTIRVTGVDGMTTTVDGTLIVPRRISLDEGDKVTLDDGSVWEVYSVDESQGVTGEVFFRTYNLTKQRRRN